MAQAPQFPGSVAYQDPYAEIVARRQKELEDLYKQDLSGSLYSPEQQQQRALENAQMTRMGQLGMLTGDRVISPLGKSIYAEAELQRRPQYKEHGIFEPVTGQFNYFPGYQTARKQELAARNLASAETQQAAGLERFERERARAHDAWQLRTTLQAMRGGGSGAGTFAGPAVPVAQLIDGTPVYRSTGKGARQEVWTLGPDGMPQAIQPGQQLFKKENLADAAVKRMETSEGLLGRLSQQLSTFQTNYARAAPGTGRLENMIGSTFGGPLQQQSDWWKGMEEIYNEIRHGLYGAALTKNEQAAFNRAIATADWSNPTTIINSIQRMTDIAEQVHNRITRDYTGYAQAARSGQKVGAQMQQFRQQFPQRQTGSDWELLNLGPPKPIRGVPGAVPVPPGIDPQTWQFLTPEQKALWQTPN